ncbi:hypothetical protein [Kibdelosporangium phytohabitans]|uniref:hypothetical protein n=1 Tax=Kibdelosporangium phytohabitans TaxID=860235 RepID=UPI0012F96316|nr:hypothetical protein [Kibdelosporangium phytohabitans]MBE1465328.1 hypothetical protein [Kibdelosporangium phytohabitans]
MVILGITVSTPQANAAIGDDWAFAFNNHLAPVGGFTLMDPARRWSKYGGASGLVRSPGPVSTRSCSPETAGKRGIAHVTSAARARS